MPSDVERRHTANVVPDVSCRGFKPGDRKAGTIVPRATKPFPTTAAGRPLIVESFAQIELVRALLMAPADDRRAVALSTPYAWRLRLSVERRPVRWRSGLLPLPRLLPPPPTSVPMAGDRRPPRPGSQASVRGGAPAGLCRVPWAKNECESAISLVSAHMRST